MRYAVAFSALFTVACWGVGDPYLEDGPDCDTMTCEDRLDINIARQDRDVFPPGAYTFAFASLGESPVEAACTMDENGYLDCAGSSAPVELALNESSNEIRARFSFAPSSVHVEVYFEDQFLGENAFSPDYTTVMPNGPECSPVCFQASVSMEVNAPSPAKRVL